MRLQIIRFLYTTDEALRELLENATRGKHYSIEFREPAGIDLEALAVDVIVVAPGRYSVQGLTITSESPISEVDFDGLVRTVKQVQHEIELIGAGGSHGP